MKSAGGLACWLVGFDCLEKAIGLQDQRPFVGDAVWLWWFAAAIWLVVGAAILASKPR